MRDRWTLWRCWMAGPTSSQPSASAVSPAGWSAMTMRSTSRASARGGRGRTCTTATRRRLARCRSTRTRSPLSVAPGASSRNASRRRVRHAGQRMGDRQSRGHRRTRFTTDHRPGGPRARSSSTSPAASLQGPRWSRGHWPSTTRRRIFWDCSRRHWSVAGSPFRRHGGYRRPPARQRGARRRAARRRTAHPRSGRSPSPLMKASQNLYGETLLRAVGRVDGRAATAADGKAAVSQRAEGVGRSFRRLRDGRRLRTVALQLRHR